MAQAEDLPPLPSDVVERRSGRRWWTALGDIGIVKDVVETGWSGLCASRTRGRRPFPWWKNS
jgi:hypothetical protein